MNTETGQIKNMTEAEMKAQGGNWIPYNLVRIPSKEACRRAWRSKYTPHFGDKQNVKSGGKIVKKIFENDNI